MRRLVVVVAAMIATFAVLNSATALAGSWTKTSLPHISDRPLDVDLDSTPPYTIRWPGEGVTESGHDDCDTTLPFKKGRRARSDLLTNVRGISKKGQFWKEGSATSADGGNHLAFFFHQKECYGGGPEYGFTRKLNEGNATLYFFQCGNCNTGDEHYTRKAVWSSAGSNRTYRILLQSDGDFAIKIYMTSSTGGLTQVHSEVIAKASWMPNLYGADGYITANAHAGSVTTLDSYSGSYNKVEKVTYLT